MNFEHYTNLKKPITKDYMLYDSIYVKFPENANLYQTENKLVLA